MAHSLDKSVERELRDDRADHVASTNETGEYQDAPASRHL